MRTCARVYACVIGTGRVYVCMSAYMFTYVRIRYRHRSCICLHECLHVHVCTHALSAQVVYVSACVRMYACFIGTCYECVCMCVHACIIGTAARSCMCLHVCVSVHVYTHALSAQVVYVYVSMCVCTCVHV